MEPGRLMMSASGNVLRLVNKVGFVEALMLLLLQLLLEIAEEEKGGVVAELLTIVIFGLFVFQEIAIKKRGAWR
jgi:hypothetical protein